MDISQGLPHTRMIPGPSQQPEPIGLLGSLPGRAFTSSTTGATAQQLYSGFRKTSLGGRPQYSQAQGNSFKITDSFAWHGYPGSTKGPILYRRDRPDTTQGLTTQDKDVMQAAVRQVQDEDARRASQLAREKIQRKKAAQEPTTEHNFQPAVLASTSPDTTGYQTMAQLSSPIVRDSMVRKVYADQVDGQPDMHQLAESIKQQRGQPVEPEEEVAAVHAKLQSRATSPGVSASASPDLSPRAWDPAEQPAVDYVAIQRVVTHKQRQQGAAQRQAAHASPLRGKRPLRDASKLRAKNQPPKSAPGIGAVEPTQTHMRRRNVSPVDFSGSPAHSPTLSPRASSPSASVGAISPGSPVDTSFAALREERAPATASVPGTAAGAAGTPGATSEPRSSPSPTPGEPVEVLVPEQAVPDSALPQTQVIGKVFGFKSPGTRGTTYSPSPTFGIGRRFTSAGIPRQATTEPITEHRSLLHTRRVAAARPEDAFPGAPAPLRLGAGVRSKLAMSSGAPLGSKAGTAALVHSRLLQTATHPALQAHAVSDNPAVARMQAARGVIGHFYDGVASGKPSPVQTALRSAVALEDAPAVAFERHAVGGGFISYTLRQAAPVPPARQQVQELNRVLDAGTPAGSRAMSASAASILRRGGSRALLTSASASTRSRSTERSIWQHTASPIVLGHTRRKSEQVLVSGKSMETMSDRASTLTRSSSLQLRGSLGSSLQEMVNNTSALSVHGDKL